MAQTLSHPAAPPSGSEPARKTARNPLWRNTGFSFGQQVAAMALAILLVPYMLAMLGPERYGLWLILQLFNLLGLAYFAELGFQGAILRYLARFHAEGDRAAFRALLSAGFWIFVVIGLVVAGSVIAFAQLALADAFPIAEQYVEDARLALTVMGAGLAIGFPGLIVKAYFTGRQELATTKVWELCDRVLFALGTLVLLQLTTSLAALVLFEQLLGLALTLAFGIGGWARSRGWFSLTPALPPRGTMGGVVRMSGSVFATSLVSQGFNRLPELFVGALLGPITLTAYQLSTRIPRVIKTLQGSLNAAVLPHIAGLDAGTDAAREERRGAFAVKGLRANYIIATPLLLVTAMLSPVLLDLWVGAQYRTLAGYMIAFSAFQALFLASNFCSATLTRQEHFRFFVSCNLVSLAIFLAGLGIGLERWGLGFVFGALLISGMAMFACVLIVFRNAHGVAVRRLLREAFLRPVLLSGAIGAALLAPGAWLLADGRWALGAGALALGGALYGLAILRLVLSGDERALLIRLAAGLPWRRRAP